MLVRRANANYRRAQALGYDRRGSGELWPLDSCHVQAVSCWFRLIPGPAHAADC